MAFNCSLAIVTNLKNSFCTIGDIRTNPKGPCFGDSGGGLVSSDYTLVGVLTAGFMCGKYNDPAIFCDVFMYKDWIQDTIRTDDLDMAKSKGTTVLSQWVLLLVNLLMLFVF